MEAESQETSGKNGPGTSLNEALTGKDTSKLRTDFEGLLELAEILQRSWEVNTDLHRRLYTPRITAIVGLLFSLGASYLVATGRSVYPPFSIHHPFPTQNVAWYEIIFFLAVVVAVGSLYLSRQLTQRLRRAILLDERNLKEVVELLREIEPVIAREENLSVLERVQIRIRLSRFGVGSSLRDDAGAASGTLFKDSRARNGRADQELMKPS